MANVAQHFIATLEANGWNASGGSPEIHSTALPMPWSVPRSVDDSAPRRGRSSSRQLPKQK